MKSLAARSGLGLSEGGLGPGEGGSDKLFQSLMVQAGKTVAYLKRRSAGDSFEMIFCPLRNLAGSCADHHMLPLLYQR